MNRVYWRAVLGLWALSLGACSTPTYDLVISNGHVMDPETGFDRVAHVGIVGSRIEAISDRPLRGNRSIDASGLVVAPGLIELHTHGEDKLNYEFRAMDGVTTMLDTERGTVDVDKWYADREGKTLVNYGISAGHSPARVQVVGGKYEGFHFSGPARTSAATPEQIEQIASLVRRGLTRGALGVGPQEAFVAALKDPNTMIISDGMVFPNLVAHPRSSGTSARVLGPLVREQKLLTLMEALRKMTLMPAQRLETLVPAMKNKGRLRVGADADLAIFDPETVADSATFGDPAKYSVGFRHVLVAGVPVVSNGELQTGVTPGRAVRGSIKD